MKTRTRVAKLIYGLGGLLSCIRTPQRTYEWTYDGDENEADVDEATWVVSHHFEYVGVAMLPSRVGIRLIELANRVDEEHFNHWALEHLPNDHCEGGRCESCGGHVHPTRNLNEEVATP